MTNSSGIVMTIDLDGERFGINQAFIDKYPESVFAKSLEVMEKGTEIPIEIDRSPECFPMILAYSRDRKAVNFGTMAHFEIRKLLNDAKFFGIDDLVERCELELLTKKQEQIRIIRDAKIIDELLAHETRMVILMDLDKMIVTCSKQCLATMAATLVNRDKCLVMGINGCLKGLDKTHDAYLYDPVNQKCLKCYDDLDRGMLLAMLHYIETLNPQIIDSNRTIRNII